MRHVKIIAGIIFFSFSANSTPLDTEYHLSARLGVGGAPIYMGASKYTVKPLIGLEAGAVTERWGAFNADETGFSWQPPIDSPFGIAMLVSYDGGRDEKIRTASGKNHDLKGMGDLKAAPEVGIALTYKDGPYYIYLKGMRTVTKRNYGGEELGYTSHAQLGGSLSFSLTKTLSSSSSLTSTWGDSKLLRGYFGVTPQQARNSQFRAYRPGSGIRDIAFQTALIYQFTPSFALQGSLGGYYLVGDAARSPLTKSRTAVSGGLAISYTF